ncbi:hypothetical protein Trydic_g23017 [Trypoxylus dichotomus]
MQDHHKIPGVADHQRNCDQQLQLFMLSYRASYYEITKQSPENVLFGRELQLPCDLMFGFKADEAMMRGYTYLKSSQAIG